MSVRSRLAVLVLVAGVVLGGCSTSLEPYLPVTDAVPVEELWARPSVEDAAAELEVMLAEVRGRWESELGLSGWAAFTDGGRSGCAGNPELTFERWSVPGWSAPVPIDEVVWVRMVEIVEEVGARYGFGPPRVMNARPLVYDATAFSVTQGQLTFGSGKRATNIGARTGCHPLAAALAERAGPPS